MGRNFLIAAVVASAILGAGYYANNKLLAAAQTDARFVMKDTKDGFLRMDRQTGHVSLCHPKANSWVCEAVADDRQVLEKEIARLDDRIGVLKRHIKKSKTRMFNLPSEEEINEVMTYFEGLVKRFRKFTDFLEEDKKAEDNI